MSMSFSEFKQTFEETGLHFDARTDDGRDMIVTGVPTKGFRNKDGDKGVIIYFFMEEPRDSSKKIPATKLAERLREEAEPTAEFSQKEWARLFGELAGGETEYDAIHVRVNNVYRWSHEEFSEKCYALNRTNSRIKFNCFAWDERDGEVFYTYNISLHDVEETIKPESLKRLIGAIRAGVDRLAEECMAEKGRVIETAGSSATISHSRATDIRPVAEGVSHSELSNEGLI